MKQNEITRRGFLKYLGAGATLAAIGCKSTDSDNAATPHAVSAGTGEMTTRTNPKTGQKVSLLGYGCMRWPTITNADGEEVIDQEMVNRLVDTAIAGGVNYFDTSPAYCKGFSERATGIALARHPRDSYFIATKLSNFAPETWSRERSTEMYRNSLKELQTDYIDYMLLHGIGMGGMEAFNGRYIDNGILDFLMAEREAGRIKNLGFSYHGDVEVFDHLLSQHDKYKWDFAQIQLNYIDWLHAKEVNPRNTNAEYLYNELHRRNIPAVIMEPLLGGRLASLNNNLVGRLKQRRPDDSVASWAFRYAGTPEGVLTVLSGMTYMEHLEDNLRTYSPLDPISPEEDRLLQDVAKITLTYPSVPCTDCKYCMPCPIGLNIPAIFAHYNKCINEGNVPSGSRDPDYEKARRAYLVGYDRAIPRERQASHCINCGVCEPHCPQGIHIPERLAAIDNIVEQLKQNTMS